jgi:hypothetical protein
MTCSTPPTSAPTASAWTRSIPHDVKSEGSVNAATRNATLRRPGANEATAKRRFVCSAAMPSAALPIRKMYGNTTRVSDTVRSNSPGRAW